MKKIWCWVPTIIWMAVIFAFSSRTAIKTSEIYWQDFVIKKTAHLVEYGILAGLMSWSLQRTVEMGWKQLLVVAWIATVAYAASDEYHQSFIPGREPRIRDVVIDSLGAGAALGFIGRASKKF